MYEKPYLFLDSPIGGRGAYATRYIHAGEVIIQFTGELISGDEVERRIERGEERIDDAMQVARDLYIDMDEEPRLFNHSCNPNAGVRGDKRIELFAIRDIPFGDEIVYDYATTVWEGEDEAWEMECHCGSPNCREVISSYQSIPREQLLEYYRLGCLTDYIRQQIETSMQL